MLSHPWYIHHFSTIISHAKASLPPLCCCPLHLVKLYLILQVMLRSLGLIQVKLLLTSWDFKLAWVIQGLLCSRYRLYLSYLSYQAHLEKCKLNDTVELFSFRWEKILHLLRFYSCLLYVPMITYNHIDHRIVLAFEPQSPLQENRVTQMLKLEGFALSLYCSFYFKVSIAWA